MRVLTLLLILANVAVYFWAHYVDVPAPTWVSTPVEMPAQAAPMLRLVKEQAAPPQTQMADVPSGCVSVGPFAHEEQASSLAQRIQGAGLSSVQRAETVDEFAGYWVTLDNYSSKALADNALKQLHANGVTDAYILTEEQSPNVLSLGLFSDRARAEARRQAMIKLGFHPVIKDRTRKVETFWLDVSLQAPVQQLDSALLHSEGDGIVRLETKPCLLGASSSEQSVSAASMP